VPILRGEGKLILCSTTSGQKPVIFKRLRCYEHPCHSLFLRVGQRRKGKQKQTTNVLIRSNNNRAKTYKVHRKNPKKMRRKHQKKKEEANESL